MSVEEIVQRFREIEKFHSPHSYPIIRMHELSLILDELEALQDIADHITGVFNAQGSTRRERLLSTYHKAQGLAPTLAFDLDAALMESLE